VSVWNDLEVHAVEGEPGQFRATISDPWTLVEVPQGGIVAAIAARAMAATLDRPDQTLRSLTAVFAGKVAGGPVDVRVDVLRGGRSMSQLMATVRNPGSAAGLTAVAVFGAPRRGFEFTDLVAPVVPSPEDVRSFRDPLPEGVDYEFKRPLMPFWEQILDCRPAVARPPWEPHVDGPAEAAYWYRIDDPPSVDGMLDPLAAVVVCDTMPGAVAQRIGYDTDWFGPSADFTVHLLNPANPGWLLGHNRARHAGGGYASVEMALWDPDGPTLVAYATQMMFFAFGV
jgi:acyl-CoA thioesterase